ncbi:MAG: Hsp20/alpha crystallin family protein [Gammaproteobacteria bacterium]|nr:Hsp20/alpha crystallin family protein [Gammaproteobacteria bacterium]NIR83998.1 Hsp20/alpha crystallin family protein [Gammaproteobacteria bacterium]NIR89142.1 Hsp20/alpha crystallin family protein [Gammaproteobacteria bacterium]NIU04944.1 Hsp20/alpha crystallin family protein [Gammaproteobacteria bacterium]NIV52110.1 Hsp20 family protein [Gammaproteobacteria bacterium]
MGKSAKKSEAGEPAAGKDIEVHREPARALKPFEEMDRLFESFFPRGWLRPFHWERPWFREVAGMMEGLRPTVDVVDRDEDILVRAEIPGVKKEDLDVSVSDGTVTIKGTTSREEKEERGEYFRQEISRGAFSRTVGLPGDVQGDKAKASFSDGVLELILPKVVKSKRRRVEIR